MMNKIKLIAGVILVFAVGVLAGSLGTGFHFKQRIKRFEAGGPPMEERIRIISGRFSNELKLTNEQQVEIEKIVKESQEKKVALGSRFLPEIKQIDDEAFTAIKDKLTEEQKAKLASLIKTMDDTRKRFPSGMPQHQRGRNQSRHGGMAPEQGPSTRMYDPGLPIGGMPDMP